MFPSYRNQSVDWHGIAREKGKQEMHKRKLIRKGTKIKVTF